MPSQLNVVLVSLLLATPVLIFWLWLVIVPARVTILCPEGCHCDPEGTSVDCFGCLYVPVPLVHLTNFLLFHLFYNNIKSLEKDNFVSLTELDYLDISACGVRTISLGVFKGLTKLTKLSISQNKISELKPGTFDYMNSLEYLDLSYNRLVRLDSAVFSGLVNLKELNIKTNNLHYLHPGTFLGLPNLQKLHLESNPGLQIPSESFVSLTELDILDISNCGMETIAPGTFKGLTKLTELRMSNNEISQTEPDTLENMNSSENLYLSRNRLQHLDSDVFRGLANIKYIDLGHNNLQYLHPDTFLRLPNIQELHFSFNPTLSIPTGRNFISSHSLSHLDISGCNVSSVSVETFANVSALESLSLGFNYLRTVDVNILRALPKLSTFYLNNNPLHCDSQLREVWRWCEDRNIETEKFGWVPACHTPSEVKGLCWEVLEKGQGLEGNVRYCGDYDEPRDSFAVGEPLQFFYENDVEFINHYYAPIYAFPFLFGTTGNIIVLIIIICNKDIRTVPNMYIFNLAISDIIYLTVFFSEAFANGKSGTWLDDELRCTFFPFCLRMSVGLSAYSVAVFSFQRYRVIANAFQVLVSSPPTWRVTVATICGVWIVAALFAVPSALSKYQCEKRNISKKYYQHVVIFELLVSCVLPLCVVAFSYAMIARRLVESSRSISEGTQNAQVTARRNTAKSVMGFAFVFMISYVPYHIYWTYFIYRTNSFLFKLTDNANDQFNKFQYSYLISKCFLLINSCLNPVALFCTSYPFRQHLKRYLTCSCKNKISPTVSELTRTT